MLQFFLKRKRFFFLLLLLFIGLTFLAKDVEKKKQYNFFDNILLTVFAFPLNVTTQSINNAIYIWDHYVYLVNVKAENTRLTKKTEKLEIENQLLREEAIENQRLRTLLSFKQKLAYKILPAEIIGRDPSSWFKTILIDKGKLDGVLRGSGVITPQGVVGKVINVALTTSKVLLITDVNSSVDTVVKRTRSSGILEGYGENSCILSYVMKTEQLLADDTIVTSGLNGVYPKGILVGKIHNLSSEKSGFFQFVEVKPSVDFSKLNEVLIVLKEKPAETKNGS